MSEWLVFGIVAVLVAVLVVLFRCGLDEEDRTGPPGERQNSGGAAPSGDRP